MLATIGCHETFATKRTLGEIGLAAKDVIIDPSEYDLDTVVADIEVIRKYNPQRHEMEQLTAIVYDNPETNICVGYKDITDDEFWIRGHMPGMPLMPGVMMCESAAQLSSYFVQRHDLLGSEMVGFGGLEDVRFRDMVVPGDRFVVMSKLLKARRGAMIVARFQGFVRDTLVVGGKIKGIPIPIDLVRGNS